MNVKNKEELVELLLYIKAVKFTLNCMLDLAESDPLYSFYADLDHYYENSIKREGVLDKGELLWLLDEVLKERKSK